MYSAPSLPSNTSTAAYSQTKRHEYAAVEVWEEREGAEYIVLYTRV